MSNQPTVAQVIGDNSDEQADPSATLLENSDPADAATAPDSGTTAEPNASETPAVASTVAETPAVAQTAAQTPAAETANLQTRNQGRNQRGRGGHQGRVNLVRDDTGLWVVLHDGQYEINQQMNYPPEARPNFQGAPHPYQQGPSVYPPTPQFDPYQQGQNYYPSTPQGYPQHPNQPMNEQQYIHQQFSQQQFSQQQHYEGPPVFQGQAQHQMEAQYTGPPVFQGHPQEPFPYQQQYQQQHQQGAPQQQEAWRYQQSMQRGPLQQQPGYQQHQRQVQYVPQDQINPQNQGHPPNQQPLQYAGPQNQQQSYQGRPSEEVRQSQQLLQNSPVRLTMLTPTNSSRNRPDQLRNQATLRPVGSYREMSSDSESSHSHYTDSGYSGNVYNQPSTSSAPPYNLSNEPMAFPQARNNHEYQNQNEQMRPALISDKQHIAQLSLQLNNAEKISKQFEQMMYVFKKQWEETKLLADQYLAEIVQLKKSVRKAQKINLFCSACKSRLSQQQETNASNSEEQANQISGERHAEFVEKNKEMPVEELAEDQENMHIKEEEDEKVTEEIPEEVSEEVTEELLEELSEEQENVTVEGNDENVTDEITDEGKGVLFENCDEEFAKQLAQQFLQERLNVPIHEQIDDESEDSDEDSDVIDEQQPETSSAYYDRLQSASSQPMERPSVISEIAAAFGNENVQDILAENALLEGNPCLSQSSSGADQTLTAEEKKAQNKKNEGEKLRQKQMEKQQEKQRKKQWLEERAQRDRAIQAQHREEQRLAKEKADAEKKAKEAAAQQESTPKRTKKAKSSKAAKKEKKRLNKQAEMDKFEEDIGATTMKDDQNASRKTQVRSSDEKSSEGESSPDLKLVLPAAMLPRATTTRAPSGESSSSSGGLFSNDTLFEDSPASTSTQNKDDEPDEEKPQKRNVETADKGQ